MDINKIIITGRLTKDPEVRYTASQTQILCFGIASNDSRKDKDTGKWVEYPNFIDCKLVGKRAEPLSNVLRKGMKVTIEGRLVNERWEKDGKKHSRHGIEVAQIVLPDRPPKGAGGPASFESGDWQDPDPSIYSDMDINF